MATKKEKNNQGLIIGICAAVVIIVIIIIAIVLATTNRGVSDSYFVSDGSKYVLTVESEDIDEDETSISPVKIHSVYNYSGDAITGLKTYYEFKDAASAKTAYDTITDEEKAEFKEVYLDGKYIVFVSNEDDYADITASEVKQNIDFINSLKDMDLSDVETVDEDDTEVEEVEEIEEDDEEE